MPDEFDQVQDRMERDEELRKKYTPKPAEIRSTGKCLYCGTYLEKGQRFCDADCRDDFEYMIYRKTSK
jgi:hypothetical protein